jgi:hypothetical protein
VPGPSLDDYQHANSEVALFLAQNVGMNVACYVAPTRVGHTIVWLDTQDPRLTPALRSAADEIVRRALNGHRAARTTLVGPKQIKDAAGVPEVYREVFSPSSSWYQSERGRATLPYSQVSIERAEHGWSKRLVLFRSGKAEITKVVKGDRSVFSWVGTADMNMYARVCYAFDTMRFMELSRSYNADWNHAPTCELSAVRNGAEKNVLDIGDVGPIELWIMQTMMDGIETQIDWREVNDNQRTLPSGSSR